MKYKFLLDYEWHYYIGGDCGLKHRKSHSPIAQIFHKEQGMYEAMIVRKVRHETLDLFSVGVFNDSNEAQAVINQILEEKFNESASAVCRMD
jgi:hypothetical protein